MEGERILKELLKKKLDGLYDDTKNYIATLTRVLVPETKNGYKFKANGCNTVEEIVSKYSEFCNKFLRCAIEILKGAKDGRDLEEIMKIVNMVMGALDLVLTYDNGKYQKFAPTFDDVGKKLCHIASQLISKNNFDMSFDYVNYCIKYLGMTNENTCSKELRIVAKSMGSLSWKAAVLLEQSSKDPSRHLVFVNALKWRICSVVFDAEAGSGNIASLVTKAVKSIAKFQMDCGTSCKDLDVDVTNDFELLFCTLRDQASRQYKCRQLNEVNYISPLFELGLHFARLFHNLNRSEDASFVFENLQSLTSELLRSMKANTSQSCLVSRFSTFNIVLTRATMLMDELLQKSVNKTRSYEKLDKLLDEGFKVLELLMSSTTLYPVISQTLEHLKHTLQPLISLAKDKHGRLELLLPNRTFQYVQLLLKEYGEILQSELESLSVNALTGKEATGVQLKQQLHKTAAKYLSLSSFVMKVYRHQIQVEMKEKASEERKQLMSKCLQYSQQCSTVITSLITNHEVCSSDELMWHGSLTFSIGMVSYKQDLFEEGAEFMSLGCSDMKQWCLCGQDSVIVRLQQLQLLPKYEALRDCQRRAKCFKEAFGTATTIMELFLYANHEVVLSSIQTELRKYLQLWLQAKHDVIKHSCQDEVTSRTLLDIIEGNSETLSSVQLGYLLQEELDCCKMIGSRYDTSLEQLSITAQLMALYRTEDNHLSLATTLLERVKILHFLGTAVEADKTPLDLCKEAVALLEAVLNDCQQGDPVVVTVQDTLASAYLWQGVLLHEEDMRQRELLVIEELESEEDATGLEAGQQTINLEQPFVLSLHAAVDMWTSMVENCLKQSKEGKINLSELANPSETSNSIKMVGLLYGILNQPLNQVHSNHLCAIINQAIGTLEALDNTIVVYSQAIHTLCNIHGLHHAQLLMSYCKTIEEESSLGPAALAQLSLAKSHLYLELGQFSEGERCLSAAFESEYLAGKTCEQVVLQSIAHSLMAKYLQIPTTVYTFQPAQGLRDRMTPLDAVIESITKLESIVNKLFTHKHSEVNINTSSSIHNTMSTISTDKNTLFAVQNLLICQMQCGSLLAHQGMVKQAIKYFTDGLGLSRKMVLPYRVAEFVNNLSLVKMQKGDFPMAKDHLLHAAHILEPVLHPIEDKTELEHCLQVPPLVNHPDTCHCVCCTDPILQSIQIDFFLTVSKYLESMEQHRNSITALEIVDELISHFTQRIRFALDEFTSTLQLGVASPDKVTSDTMSNKGGARKKGRGRTSKAKQPTKAISQDGDVSLLSTTQIMYSCHLVQVFVQNAVILLGNNKLKKALEVVKGGMNVVQDMEKITGSTTLWLMPFTTHLLYLQGVIYVLQALDNDGTALDYVWPVHGKAEYKLDDTVKVTDCIKEKKKSGRGRSVKVALPANDVLSLVDDVEKTVKRKGRGRSKVSDLTQDNKTHPVEDQRESSSRKRKVGKGNNVSQGLQLAVDTFTKALDLCCCWPQPKLFSQLCQGVALCYGQCQKTVHYLDMSLGVTLRYEAAYSARKKIRKLSKDNKSQMSCEDMASLTDKVTSLRVEDHQPVIESLQESRQMMLFQSHLAELDSKNTPTDWTICTLIPVKLPGHPQQLIISRQRPGTRPILVKVPMPESGHDDNNDDTISNEQVNKAVMDLSQLFQGSIQQEFTDIMQSSSESMGINDSKEWHHARSRLDRKLKNLLGRMENSWLGIWKGIVLGQNSDSHQQEALVQTTKDLSTKLAKQARKTVDVDLLEILVDSNDYLTVLQAMEALSVITGLERSSPELDEVLNEFKQCASSLKTRRPGQKKSQISNDRHPVVLILGKDIQHLPWESIPILRDYPVTRMPSMHLVLAQTPKAEGHGQSCVVDPKKAYYVLNPENNLPNTQKIFQNWFESELKWHGVTGQKPSQDQYKSALVDHELFLYLGHGTGQSFLRGDDVQRINCKATTMLMGCSSAKLMVGGICEPRGMSLSYLLAGCPAILGNLWDVTDRDIDRFTKSLLQAWLQSGQNWSLPQFIRNARQACKWPYLIGASPVLYGIPVFLKN